jgi:transcription initiation factor TFIID subunit TAF12
MLPAALLRLLPPGRGLLTGQWSPQAPAGNTQQRQQKQQQQQQQQQKQQKQQQCGSMISKRTELPPGRGLLRGR